MMEPSDSQFSRQNTNEIVNTTREEWALKTWVEKGDKILHGFRNYLIAGAFTPGYNSAQVTEREELEPLRDTLLDLVHCGLDLQDIISKENISSIDAQTRKKYFSELNKLRNELVELSGILSLIHI